MKMANMDDYFDVVIVGTGAAGLYCALNLPSRYRILLLAKQKADESDSFLAQGGICMQHGEADYRPFFDDTMRAGHYENNPATVDLMIRSSAASALRGMTTGLCALPGRERTPARAFCSMRILPATRSPRPC